MISIQKKITQGEGRHIEFKREFGSPAKIAQTAVAFANGGGGEMFFGVEDNGEIRGIPRDSVFELGDRLSNLVYETCMPLIMTEVFAEYFEDKPVLALKVFPGADKPYYIRKKGKERGVYIRVGASNRKADMPIIAELERQKRNISFDEEIAYDFSLDDLDFSGLSRVFEKCAGSVLTESDQLNLKLLKHDNERVLPTKGGVLMAGKRSLNDFCGIRCARFKGTGMREFIDKKDYIGPLPEIVEQALMFAKNHIPLSGKISGIRRIEKYEIPMTAIREAVLNAVVHRDYSIDGSDVKLAIYDDIVEISSPGCLPNTLDLEDLMSGRSEIRNKVIARFFEKIGFIEKWGTGIKKMVQLCQECGLESPEFQEKGYSFQVTFRRSGIGSYTAENRDIPRKMTYPANHGEGARLATDGLDMTRESRQPYRTSTVSQTEVSNLKERLKETFSLKEKKAARLAQILSSLRQTGAPVYDPLASKRTNEGDVRILKEHGLLIFVGARKNGHYELTKQADTLINETLT